MSGTFVVAARELVERRSVLIAALVAGFLPFASPLLPGVAADRAAEARDSMSIVLAVAFGVGSALMLGATVVGRDLSEGRLGFDFSRPLRGGQIWAGRFLGAMALTLAVFAIVVLPASAVGGGILNPFFLPAWSAALLAGLLLVLPAAHTVGVAFRSRSAWLGTDMVLAIVVLLVAFTASRRLFDAFAVRDLAWSLAVAGALALPALWTASAMQVISGRTDLRRGHRIQSVTLWGALLLIVLSLDGYTRWVVSAGPEDLVSADGGAAPAGTWLAVSGEARGRGDFTPSFLVDGATGRFVRLGAAQPWGFPGVTFSGDGKRAVWLRTGGPRDPRQDVLILDLEHPAAGFTDTRISFSSPWVDVAVSENGGRMAVLEGEVLSVYDLDSGALLASAKLGASAPAYAHRSLLFFLDPERVRVYLFLDEIKIQEMDVAAKKIVSTGASAVGLDYPRIAWDRTRDRILVRDLGRKGTAVLLDGRSGATLATLTGTEEPPSRHGFRLLADGGIVFVERQGTAAKLKRIAPTGQEERSIDLAMDGVPGGEVAPGKLIVAEGARRGDGFFAAPESKVLLADLGTGEVREVARGLFPLMAVPWRSIVEPPPPGGTATVLFVSSDGSLVLLDPLTGKRRIVAGRSVS